MTELEHRRTIAASRGIPADHPEHVEGRPSRGIPADHPEHVEGRPSRGIPADPAAADPRTPAEAEHWTYYRDPLEGISLFRMALWVLLLIPALEMFHRLFPRRPRP